MTLFDLVNGIPDLQVPTDADPNLRISSLCHDSRKAERGALFVCIKGATSDGHHYAKMAYERGCRVFAAEHPLENVGEDATVLLCPDTRVALATLSARFFGNPADRLVIIGITGTKGKTTSALMIYNILNACGLPCGYIGSNGIDYRSFHGETPNTTPESYTLQMFMKEMVDVGVRYLVMEVSSQALYLHRVHGIRFDVCVFTNLSEDHIGGAEHPDFEHYKNCKKSLFSDYGAKTVIFNLDDPFGAEMANAAPEGTGRVSISAERDADYRAEDATPFRKKDCLGISFRYSHGQSTYEASLNFPGRFSVYNALSAIAVCHACGLPLDTVADRLAEVYVKGRFEMVRALPYATFIIDYAHNRASLTSALETIRSYNPSRLICLFGSVGGRTQCRRAELGSVASQLADFCILTSDNPDFEDPDAILDDIASQFRFGGCDFVRIPDRAEAIRYAVSMAKEGDVFLLAGKGHEDYQLILGEKRPFCERDLLLEAAAALSSK